MQTREVSERLGDIIRFLFDIVKVTGKLDLVVEITMAHLNLRITIHAFAILMRIA